MGTGNYHRDNVPEAPPQPWAKFWRMFMEERDLLRGRPPSETAGAGQLTLDGLER
jgi:hypothetical protein